MTETEEKQKDEVSEKEERIAELAKAIRAVKLVRGYGIKKSYLHVANELVNITRLVTDGRRSTGRLRFGEGLLWAGDIELRFMRSNRNDVGPWVAQMVFQQDVSRNDHLEDDIIQFVGGNMHYSGFIHNLLPEIKMSDMFYSYRPEFWEVCINPAVKGLDDVGVWAKHVACNLFAFEFDDELAGRIKVGTIQRQMKEYILYGKVLFEKYPEVVPDDVETHPLPLLTVNDNNDGLVWKHGKYCDQCGGLIAGCYCTPVYRVRKEEINQATETCWECIKEAMYRVLTGYAYAKKEKALKRSDEGNLDTYLGPFMDSIDDWWENADEEMRAEMEEFLDIKIAGGPIEQRLKQMTREQAERFLCIVNEEYGEYGDFEPPEDSCSCPAE